MPTLLLLMLKGLFTPKQMFIGKIWHDKHFNFYQPVVNASVQAKKIGQSVIFALLVTCPQPLMFYIQLHLVNLTNRLFSFFDKQHSTKSEWLIKNM